MIFGFLLTALYWPGLSGAATTPKWGLLAIALPILLWRGLDTKITLAHLFGALFVTWSAASLLWTPNRLDGTGELIRLVLLAQAFLYGSSLASLRPLLTGMACGLILSSATVLIQLVYPDIVLHTTAHSGLFINSGTLGEITALVLIGMIYYRCWWLALVLLPCIVLPQSRGAWLALVAAGIVWTWGRSKLSALAIIAISAILLTYSLHLGFHASSVVQRLGMYWDAISGLTWLGHGVGSFWTDYAPLSTTLDIFIERPEHLHNDWLEIVFEQGAVGAGAVVILGAWCLFNCARRPTVEGYIFIGFAAEAIVGFPLHNPCTAFVAALCLGHLARGGIGVRELVHGSRVFLQARLGAFNTRRQGDGSAQVSRAISA